MPQSISWRSINWELWQDCQRMSSSVRLSLLPWKSTQFWFSLTKSSKMLKRIKRWPNLKAWMPVAQSVEWSTQMMPSRSTLVLAHSIRRLLLTHSRRKKASKRPRSSTKRSYLKESSSSRLLWSAPWKHARLSFTMILLVRWWDSSASLWTSVCWSWESSHWLIWSTWEMTKRTRIPITILLEKQYKLKLKSQTYPLNW